MLIVTNILEFNNYISVIENDSKNDSDEHFFFGYDDANEILAINEAKEKKCFLFRVRDNFFDSVENIKNQKVTLVLDYSL